MSSPFSSFSPSHTFVTTLVHLKYLGGFYVLTKRPHRGEKEPHSQNKAEAIFKIMAGSGDSQLSQNRKKPEGGVTPHLSPGV